jgi:hypothetical protein
MSKMFKEFMKKKEAARERSIIRFQFESKPFCKGVERKEMVAIDHRNSRP